MGFSFKTSFAHLHGKTLTYGELMDDIIRVRRENLGDLAPEISTHDMLYQMMQMGWVSFPDDGSGGNTSTCIFTIREDVREVRKRIERYKADFIREQAKTFLSQEEEDGQFYPADVDTKEYRTAVRELAFGNS
jgi:hypothetical protein